MESQPPLRRIAVGAGYSAPVLSGVGVGSDFVAYVGHVGICIVILLSLMLKNSDFSQVAWYSFVSSLLRSKSILGMGIRSLSLSVSLFCLACDLS